jgi:hypothetical protein
MIITSTLTKDAKLTEEQLKELEEAKKLPITYDEDCPELTHEMEMQFKCAVRMRNRLIEHFSNNEE